MDSKEQIIVSLKRENDYLKRENEFLKSEFIKITGAYPGMEGYNTGSVFLPPILNNFNGNKTEPSNNDAIIKLKEEYTQMKKTKETLERQIGNLINENMILTSKLNNLENVFIGSNILRNKDGSVTNDIGENYNSSVVY